MKTTLLYNILSYLPDVVINNKDILEVDIRCKFIIVSTDNSLSFIYGQLSEFPYHADILKKYCDENDIPSHWERKPDLFHILDNRCRINGGGWLEINFKNKILDVYGYSTAYGKYKEDDLTMILENNGEFEAFEIFVD